MRAAYRGQPLVALMLILGGWVAARAMVWDASASGTLPVAGQLHGPDRAAAERPPAEASLAPEVSPAPKARLAPPAPAVFPAMRSPVPILQPDRRPLPVMPLSAPFRPSATPAPVAPMQPSRSVARRPAAARVPAQLSVAHQLLWMAALARLPLPISVLAPLAAAVETAPADPPVPQRGRRWSADAWLLLRHGGNHSGAGGLVPATYGASQAGGVVRYGLAPESAHRPSLYLRGSAALNGAREREAALGLSARPFARVPLVVAAEARAHDQPRGARLRPAAFAYTELPPLDLPHGARAEFYGQAGYVGGDFAGAFADGHLRVDRRVLRAGPGELRAGGALWGGAQKGASRLDLGPSAAYGMPLGRASGARVQVDWRFRVAGNAAPASGPAVTLSAGF
jgi:hypothetical protein